MRWSKILFLTLWSLISAGEIHSKEITLFSHFIDSSPSITGERILLKQNFTPASTFKYWIALFLIEKNLVYPSFQKISSEKHIPHSPRALNLRDAMLYSSNSFFLSFLEDEPKRYEELQDFLMRIGFVAEVYKNPFLNRKNLYLSPAIEKSPESQHNFLVSFLKDEGRSRGVSSKTFQFWKESAFWSECDSQNSILYGKTGSLGGVFWFLGFLEKKQKFWERWTKDLPKEYSVITVLQTGEGSSREGAIRSFYRIAGCENEIENVLKRISE
ncbi:penicillin-binding transpeptidase domain-containing protein [Leptospira stimsonii]|uniref:Penicillin-binding protein transpeptidase domain-containing protein n=1 Tax=Leptospira stimsonii TaxID=2202203 RepID=A0A8B3CR70_9LEPT|nr:penicillin-binding transpeptidase domain-containing protein [Leptospira stimsonii]RHX85267.1 hypothetical protein DLM78_14200 [Leptospira stimsonii]